MILIMISYKGDIGLMFLMECGFLLLGEWKISLGNINKGALSCMRVSRAFFQYMTTIAIGASIDPEQKSGTFKAYGSLKLEIKKHTWQTSHVADTPPMTSGKIPTA